MVVNNFDATTPQTKAVKNLLEAYLTLDVSNALPFVSKDFDFQTFPKIAGLPDEPKEGHFERYGPIFGLMNKVEVNIDEAIEAPGKVVIHVEAVFHAPDGEELGYDSLVVLTLVEENGEIKVAGVKDFSDPEKRGNLHAWVAKALAKRAT